MSVISRNVVFFCLLLIPVKKEEKTKGEEEKEMVITIFRQSLLDIGRTFGLWAYY